jgi:hypothetical protein
MHGESSTSKAALVNADNGNGERLNTETKSKDLHRVHREKAEENLRKIEAFTAA